MLRKSFKALLSLVFAAVCLEGNAAVTVTPASGGTNVPADRAQNAASPAFTTLGDIIIQEGANNDFSNSGTIIFSAPAGWQFKPGVGSASRQNGRDLGAPTISVDETTITITFTLSGTTKTDRLTISGIQVQAGDGATLPSNGTIFRTGGTATVAGITASTSFGSLSQAAGATKNLIIQTQPSANAIVGMPFVQQPVLHLFDQFNNMRTADNLTVVTAARLTGAGTLAGTLTAVASNGVVSFANLFHTVVGTITLSFNSGVATGAISDEIAVYAAGTPRLGFVIQPADVVVGAPFTVQVRTEDSYGNASSLGLPASLDVTISLSKGSGTLLGTLTQDIGTEAGNGEVIFSDLHMNEGGAGKQLTASADGFISVTSDTFKTGKQTQTISFDGPSEKTYGDSPFPVTATASSSFPVSFVIMSGPATLSEETITITGVGEVTVRATQAGNDFYDEAEPVDQSFSVAQAFLQVSADNVTRVYGDANPPLTGSISGIQNDDAISVFYSTGAGIASAVGDYAIVLGLNDPDGRLINYNVETISGTLTITAASLTVTADDKTRAVGDENPVLTGTLTGLKNSDNITPILETAATQSSLVGNYPITINGVEDPDGKLGNYSVTYNEGTLAIIDTPMIVDATELVIADEGDTIVLTVEVSGNGLDYQWLFEGDVIANATSSSHTIENVRNVHAGSYSITASNGMGSAITSVQLQVVPDNQKPVLTTIVPGSNKVYTEPSLVVSGIASDNVRVVSVKQSLNNAEFTEVDYKVFAESVTAWSSTVTPAPGTNTISFAATDLAGNSSTSAVVKFIYNQPSPLTIVTNGIGTVLNPTAPSLYSDNNTNLFIGRPYRLVAKETGAPDWILTNWTDGNGNILQTNNLTVRFLMEEDMVVNANFIPNPFYRFGGVYNGLFSDTNNGVAYESAGFVTLKVTPKLGFSGKLLLNGNALGFSGKLGIDGTASATTKIRSKSFEKPEVTVRFALDFNGASETLSGTVAQDGEWVSDLKADRVIWTTNILEQATAFANAYTMLLPGFTNKNEGPIASGYGLVTIDKRGKLKLAGGSADGQVLKQATVVSKDGAWPFFAPAYKQVRFHSLTQKKITETKGFVLGWLNYETNALGNMAPAGNLHWINTGADSLYANGFTNQNLEVIGSRWLPPIAKSGIRAVEMTNVVISFAEGNLSEPFEARFMVSSNTTLLALKTETYLNKVKAGLAAKTGLLKGTFAHPEDPAPPTKYAGVLVQDYNFGSGFFIGTNESGSVELDPIEE
ncbi:MAG: hypothetical protein H0X66_09350 [Verrucomicrobia bacterium]|nr:hypothetical protein [Verrucomicrobiota bacterium]